MQTQDFIELENRLGAHNYKPLDVVLTRGQDHIQGFVVMGPEAILQFDEILGLHAVLLLRWFDRGVPCGARRK